MGLGCLWSVKCTIFTPSKKDCCTCPVSSLNIQKWDTRLFWNFKKTPISHAFKGNFWKITPYFVLKQGQFCFQKYPYFYHYKGTFHKIPLFVQKQAHHSKGNTSKMLYCIVILHFYNSYANLIWFISQYGTYMSLSLKCFCMYMPLAPWAPQNEWQEQT